MSFLRGRNILWLLLPATFVVAFLWDSSVQQKPDFIRADSNPDYYLVDTSTVEFNAQGQPIRHFTSEKTLHFKELMQTRLEQPTFEMISVKRPWQVSADHAVSSQLSEQLALRGDVEIVLKPNENQPDIIMSMPKLKIDFTTQTAFTNSRVELKNGIFRQTAIGMNADLRANTIEFKSQVVSEEL